nr:hypothetical protein [Armatimonas sp.]
MQLVRVIVDPEFGERLASLAPDSPIWIVQSAVNTPVVQRLWQEKVGEITSFVESNEGDAESDLIEILGTVDLHHAEYTHIEIIGCLPSETIRTELEALGLQIISSNHEGFLAAKGIVK